LATGVSTLFQHFIVAFAAHGVAKLIFRGTGTFAHMLDKFTALNNRNIWIIWVLYVVFVIITLVAQAPLFIFIISAAIAGISIRLLFKSATVIGEAYDFGMAGGCLSLLIGYGIIALIGFGIQVAIGTVLINALSGQLGIPLQ
jgi:hypothetical protein